jgi:hypothetical protein
MAWAAALDGCQVDVSGIPLTPIGSDQSGRRDGGNAEPREGHEAGVARSDSGVEHPDGGRPGGEDSKPITHASCIVAPPSAAPAPAVKRDATGRPTFDWWRDLDCGAIPALETCREDLDTWSCQQCLYASEATEAGAADAGLCVYDWNLSDCLQLYHAVANVRQGSCLLCETPEWKAQACCSGALGIDCRAWPYPADSRPGEPCARHADCEPGLLCKVSAGMDFGVCTCPEAVPSPTSCFPPT